jgi:hypothetical protein
MASGGLRIMDIRQEEPATWKQLQKYVAQVYYDMGYQTELEKKVETARGPVVVDVFAKGTEDESCAIHICECKYWNRRVPKTVVHAFRTVVADSGANVGCVISKAGFQKGAREAVANTNVVLLSWTDFQIKFFNQWWRSVVDRLHRTGKPLRERIGEHKDAIDSEVFYDYLMHPKTRRMWEWEHEFYEKHTHLADISNRLWWESFEHKFPYRFRVQLPSLAEDERIFYSHFELINTIQKVCEEAIVELDGRF